LEIKLAYGKNGLSINLNRNWDVTVIEPRYINEIADPVQILQNALRDPIGVPALSEIVGHHDRIGIVFSDITRPTPNEIIITQIIKELDQISPENIILYNALGTHRSNTEPELRCMLGDDLVDHYRIIQNNAFEKLSQVYLGKSSFGHDIWLNKDLMECDLIILTGFIEPHFFAGFSGGCKALMPGMAGLITVLGNHGFDMISHPRATWGMTEGNPIWQEINEVSDKSKPLFLVNVTLNKNKKITGVFCGDLKKAYAAGCDFVREFSMVPVTRPFDIVITTNSGYPLDMNLYQSIKGISAASRVVRKGGIIILAAECSDGIPEHGCYRQLLQAAKNPRNLLQSIEKKGFEQQDQWQVQIQAQIQLMAEVFVYSPNLSDAQITEAMFKPCRSIEQLVSEKIKITGPNVRICVLPEGPQSIPYLID